MDIIDDAPKHFDPTSLHQFSFYKTNADVVIGIRSDIDALLGIEDTFEPFDNEQVPEELQIVPIPPLYLPKEELDKIAINQNCHNESDNGQNTYVKTGIEKTLRSEGYQPRSILFPEFEHIHPDDASHVELPLYNKGKNALKDLSSREDYNLSCNAYYTKRLAITKLYEVYQFPSQCDKILGKKVGISDKAMKNLMKALRKNLRRGIAEYHDEKALTLTINSLIRQMRDAGFGEYFAENYAEIRAKIEVNLNSREQIQVVKELCRINPNFPVSFCSNISLKIGTTTKRVQDLRKYYLNSAKSKQILKATNEKVFNVAQELASQFDVFFCKDEPTKSSERISKLQIEIKRYESCGLELLLKSFDAEGKGRILRQIFKSTKEVYHMEWDLLLSKIFKMDLELIKTIREDEMAFAAIGLECPEVFCERETAAEFIQAIYDVASRVGPYTSGCRKTLKNWVDLRKAVVSHINKKGIPDAIDINSWSIEYGIERKKVNAFINRLKSAIFKGNIKDVPFKLGKDDNNRIYKIQ